MNSVSRSPITPPSPIACQVWKWFSAQKSTIELKSLAAHEEGKLLLPIFGTLHIAKLLPLLDSSSQRTLTQKVRQQVEAIQEILRYHLTSLIHNQPIQLPPASIYLHRSAYDVTPLDYLMLRQVRQALALSPCPSAEARYFKLHRIPQYGQDDLSMSVVLESQDSKNRQYIDLLLSWFDEYSPSLQSRTLIPQQWMELVMTALRLEAWPGTSYCEAIIKWGLEQAREHETDDCVATKLRLLWQQSCPFYTLLQGQNVVKMQPQQDSFVFNRPDFWKLESSETLRSYITKYSQQVMLASLLRTSAIKQTNFNIDSFTFTFCQRFKPFFVQDKLRGYLLYFVSIMTESYQKLPRNNYKAAYDLFRAHYKFLNRLLQNETIQTEKRVKTLPEDNKNVYSFLLSILLYYHTVHLAPDFLPLDLNWFTYFVELTWEEKQLLLTQWNQFVAQINHPLEQPFDFPSLIKRWTTTLQEQVSLATAIIADCNGLRPPGAVFGFSEHLNFIHQIENKTQLRISQSTGQFILTCLPLKTQIQEHILKFKQFKKALRAVADSEELYIQDELVDEIEMWNLSELPTVLTPRNIPTDTNNISSQIVGEICTLMNYSLLPTGLNWLYCRFLILAQSSLPTTDPNFNVWTWATLHNNALIELSPGLRAMRCEVTINREKTKLEFSILWVSSLTAFTTRQIRATLSLSTLDLESHDSNWLIQLASKLCSNRKPEGFELATICPQLIQCCATVKHELTKAILEESQPVIQFNAQEQCLYLSSLERPLPLPVAQVRINDYAETFHLLLRKMESNRELEELGVFTAQVFITENIIDAPIDCLYQHTVSSCMGDGDDEMKVKPKNFYKVILRFSQFHHVFYSMIYLERPTVGVIAWQLALLKDRFCRLRL